VEVPDRLGRPIRVLAFGDGDLLFCIPFTLACLLFRLASQAVLHTLLVPIHLAARGLRVFRGDALKLALVAPLPLAALFGASHAAPALDALAAIAAFLLVGVCTTRLSGNLAGPRFALSPSEQRTLERMRREARSERNEWVKDRFSRPAVYWGAVMTLQVLPTLVLFLLAPPSSWFRLAMLAGLFLFARLANFETVEHIASHSVRGELLKRGGGWPIPRGLELIRRWVIWPLFSQWQVDRYYVLHQQHHVENNGPADYQSMIRFDRASVLDFTKAVTWFGLNTIVPFDTLYYLGQRRRFALRRRLAVSLCAGVALMAGLCVLAPTLAALLFGCTLFSAIDGYEFTGKWHLFHDPGRLSTVEGSNNDLLHWLHHLRPSSLHLLDSDGFQRLASRLPPSPHLHLIRPGTRFWRLQGLLWARAFARAGEHLARHADVVARHPPLDFYRVGAETDYPPVEAEVVRGLVAPYPLTRRSPSLGRMDRWLSARVGRLFAGGPEADD
jgi:hypothetical protein